MAISELKLSQVGFHLLKKECKADARIESVVKQIIEWFDVLVENTARLAPLRTTARHGKDPFRLKRRDKKTDAKLEESKLERSFAEQWNAYSNPTFPVPGCGGFVNYKSPCVTSRARGAGATLICSGCPQSLACRRFGS